MRLSAKHWLLCIPLMSIAAVPGAALAQDAESFHWAYASFLGTGFYRVRDDQEVFVLDLEPDYPWREPDPERAGFGQTGVSFQFPLSLGVHHLNVFDAGLNLDNFGTVSFTPGVELVWLAGERWTVVGDGHLGWGTETSGDGQAIIWDISLRSRYALESGRLEWGVFNEVFAAGYDPKGAGGQRLGGFGTGLDFSWPVSWTSNSGEPLNLNWDVTYRWYGDALTFGSRSGLIASIDDEWRVGVALALRDGPIKLGFFEFEQIGFAYRVDSSGEFRGITLNVSSPLWR